MREPIQLLGVIMFVQGISGTIDHLAVQPFFGPLLNFFNRFIISRVDFIAGYELFANLILAVLGLVVVIAAERTQPS